MGPHEPPPPLPHLPPLLSNFLDPPLCCITRRQGSYCLTPKNVCTYFLLTDCKLLVTEIAVYYPPLAFVLHMTFELLSNQLYLAAFVGTTNNSVHTCSEMIRLARKKDIEARLARYPGAVRIKEWDWEREMN